MAKHGYSVANPRIVWLAKAGGADRDRTDDLKLAKLPLSQLSYGPSVRVAHAEVRNQKTEIRKDF